MVVRVILLCAFALLGFGASQASADVVWLCKPGIADDPCAIGLDTTFQEAGQPDRVETPAAGAREIDCFYVYPTVSNQLTPNATKARDPELKSIAKYQAARFNRHCRVFAPVYRQSTLASIATGYLAPSGADRDLAYADVLEAWRAYLEEDDQGRGVVLVGHSQGTGMLRRLLRNEIEKDPAQRRRLISALLLGGDVTVADGKVVGGDFERTPLCTRRAQVGCVVAFSTFYEDPPPDSRFGTAEAPPAGSTTGLPGGPGHQVACTDPRPLAGVEEPFRLLVPSEPFAPGLIAAGIVITSLGPPPSAATTWVSPPDRGEGSCRLINGAHVLRLEPLPGSRRPMWYPESSWGTHLIDVNLALDPLVSLVGQQAERWVRPDVRLRRRCRDGRLHLRITGREAEFVRRADFEVGRRRVARDTSPAFKATVARKRLAKTGARRVRAVVRLKHGAPQRLVLVRGRGGC